MPKKRKLNSKNPKYWKEEAKKEPEVLEKKLLSTNSKKGVRIYAVFLK